MRKVAIVGGGMGGLASAFELVSSHPGKYEIDVYERDWRLGGKGASGRNLDPALGYRIEEHGLHILMGFYENVFEIMNRCYADLRSEGRLPLAKGVWWNGVLHPFDEILFSEPPHGRQKEWVHWSVPFLPNSRLIGAPAQPMPSIRELFVTMVKDFVQSVRSRLGTFVGWGLDLKPLELLSMIDPGELRNGKALSRSLLRSAIKSVLETAYRAVGHATGKAHRWFVALYFSGLNLIGILDDVLPNEAGFPDALDHIDYKDWIEQYNFLKLDPLYHRESAPVNAVYDLVFSRGVGFGAGSALYDTMLMLFHYKGHIFYKMAGGMGDVVFAPLYLWLRDRGVRFHFFHDLVDIELSADRRRIDALVFEVSHTPIDGAYDPLIDVTCSDDDGDAVTLPCWPSAPKPGLDAGPGKVGVADLEAVVLAIPVGAIREKTSSERARCEALYVDSAFRAMAEGMVTRCTRAVQLWFDCDLSGLGWKDAPSDPALGPVVGSYLPAMKHNSWADMTQVLPRETWSVGRAPKNVAYLADAFDEPLTGEAADARVHDDVLTWLADAAGGLWPKTARPFPWDMLHDPAGRTGAERLEAQYWRANTDGSSQYVTGAPNTTALRLDPHGTQFSNLFLAGDWVKTPLNAGSVEGAAMGGRLAGQRIAEHFVSEGHAGVPGSQYIERDGDLPLLQPVVLGAARMHGYVLKADQDALERTLAATFSPLGITCTPLLPIVVVTSVQVDEIRSQLRPNDGYMTEAELGFWLPVAMKWNGGSSRGLYLPYLFVDNPAAMLAGREIYGFNKILAQFRYRASGDIDPVEIKAQVLHTRAAQTRLDWQPVVSIATERPNETSLWHSSGELISSVVGKIVDQFPGAVLGNALSLPSAPVFFLKQLRAAGQGARTCMQQAITARVSVAPGTVSGGWLPPFGVELSFTAHATLDIATTLGLKPTAKPWLAFWASCSATLEAGQVLGGNAGVDE